MSIALLGLIVPAGLPQRGRDRGRDRGPDRTRPHPDPRPAGRDRDAGAVAQNAASCEDGPEHRSCPPGSGRRWSRFVKRTPWCSAPPRWSSSRARRADLLAAPGHLRPGQHPESTTTRQAYDLIAEGFGGGSTALSHRREDPDGDGPAQVQQPRRRRSDRPRVASVARRSVPQRAGRVDRGSARHRPAGRGDQRAGGPAARGRPSRRVRRRWTSTSVGSRRATTTSRT